METTTEQLYRLYLTHPVICTDTREIKPDSIFFALKGTNFDANKFAEQAIYNGSSYAVIDNPIYKKDDQYLLVKDVLETLQNLANHHRHQLHIPFIAITGTNGKTTTKELIAAVLSKKYKTLATKGNLNNHIGVPLTLLSINKDHEIAVIEMGANHIGEIAALCKIAEPDYGIITNIGKAHLEGFGSPEGVIKTKNELYQFIGNHNGKLFINTDNDLLMDLASALNKISYGSSQTSFCTGKITEANPLVKVAWEQKKLKIQTKLIGKYNFENIMAAICVGDYFSVSPALIKQAIEDYNPTNSRSQILKTKNNTLILDAYNANPTSMQGAIENFAEITAEHKAIILGDMFELGEASKIEHETIFHLVKLKNFEKTVLIGKYFNAITSETINASCFETTEQAYSWLKENPIKNFTILVKGSRGIKLEKLVELL